MKWYEASLKINGIPTNEYAIIVGILDDGNIKINVEHHTDNGQQIINEWTKVVNMWQSIEPTNEEIQEKYWKKLSKIRIKNEKYRYIDWIQYLKIRAKENAGLEY